MRGTFVRLYSHYSRHLGGEPEAARVDALYRRFGSTITRRARALLRDDDEARDITQETFLAYLRCKDSLRGEASAFTVLYQIATNKALDRLRRRARRADVPGALDAQEDEESTRTSRGPPQAEDMARVEAMMELEVLTRGESRQRLTAAILHFVEGYSLEEVARVLETSRRSVSALLREFAARARARGDLPTWGRPPS